MAASWYSPEMMVQIGLLLVGVVYSVFAALQWRAIRRQAEIASQAARLEYRPWVVPTGHGRVETDTHDAWLRGDTSILRLTIDLTNTGKTPAAGVTLKLGCTLWAADTPMPGYPTDIQSEAPLSVGAIGPGLTIPCLGAIPNFSQEKRTAIGMGAGFVVFGLINYEGHGGGSVPYATKFSFEWRQDEGRFVSRGHHKFT